MFFPVFLSCTSNTIVLSPESTRIEYVLDREWSSRPWDMQTDPKGQSTRIEATFEIDKSDPREGAGIRFSGLWWKGTLQVNGTALPSFYGGNQEVEIPIGEQLNIGQNHLVLQLEGPQNISSRVTGGTPSSITRQKNTADLFFPPRLLLRPKDHISGMALPLRGNNVTPVVWAEGARASTVELYVEQDGKQLAHLGNCAITNGRSECSSQRWTLDKWTIGDPHLYQLRGILKDQQGEILDQLVETVGVRDLEWSKSGIQLNQKSVRLLSARMVHRRGGEDFFSRLQLYRQAGINTLEFHGELLRRDWLSILDEMGMAVAIVPRCIGRSNHKNGGSSQNQPAFIRLQDQRLLWDIKTHPSVTLFALEGAGGQWSPESIWSDALQNNIHNIPVFGQDLPIRLLKMELRGETLSSTCLPENCDGSWLVETVIQSQFPPWDLLSQEYLRVQNEGAIGGVIPTPRKKIDPQEQQQWLQAWKEQNKALQPTPLSASPQRASSTISVQANPGDLITIRAAGINTQRKKATNSGIASFNIFYQGALDIQCGESTIQANISADQWKDFQKISTNDTITCRP